MNRLDKAGLVLLTACVLVICWAVVADAFPFRGIDILWWLRRW